MHAKTLIYTIYLIQSIALKPIFRYSFIIFLSLSLLCPNVIWANIYISAPNKTLNNPSEGILISDNQIQGTFEVKKFLQNTGIFSLNEYIAWYKKNLSYKSDDGKDIWSSPQETLQRGYGDCEDLAFLNQAVLRYFGYEARVLAAGIGKSGHVFCVFKRNGIYHIFDNMNYLMVNVNSLEKIAKYLLKNLKKEYVLELTLNPRHISVLYRLKA